MNDDPGWGPVLRNLPFAVVPHLAVWASRRRSLDGLTSLRLLYVSLLVTLGWIFAALPSLALDGTGQLPAMASLFLVTGFAMISYAGLLILRGQRLDVSDSDHAADLYRSRMLLTLAFSMAIPLVALVLVLISDSAAPYYLGVALALPGFLLAAPTHGDVERRQHELDERLDLIEGLVERTGIAAPMR